jgi:hypothetical protein
MVSSAKAKSYVKAVVVVLLGSATCASVSGCLLAAAGAGAAGGYMLGRESEKDKSEVHIHETHVDEPPPPSN